MDDLTRFRGPNSAGPTFGQRDAGNLTVCGWYGRPPRRLLYGRARTARFSERKGAPCSTPGSPTTGRGMSGGTGPTGAGSARRPGSPGRTRARSVGTPSGSAPAPASSPTSGRLFPPRTTRAPVDETWALVGNEEKGCGPDDAAEGRGDGWDHVALDPDRRLVLDVAVGPRTADLAVSALEGVRDRLGGRAPGRITGDEWSAAPEAISTVFGETGVPPRTGRPGRPAGSRTVPPAGMCDATVRQTREGHRVVAVEERIVFGKLGPGDRASTSDLERPSATDRHRSARKARKTYRFSKGLAIHVSVPHSTQFADNFCWPVRTL